MTKLPMLSRLRRGDVVPAGAKTTSGLDLLGGAKTQIITLPPPAPALPQSNALPARLVFAADATASREEQWEAAKELTDALFSAIPGGIEVALAVHGGGRLHTWTPFTSRPDKLRDLAARVKIQAGETRLLDVLRRTLEDPRISVVVYIGDRFEESRELARQVAKALKLQQTRLIILHDRGMGYDLEIEDAASVFAALAELTGGTVLPFDISALARLRELLAAVAVLAIGGTSMLAAKQETMPGARLLLQHLKEDKS